MKIMVASPKGGVGKTALSLGLASVATRRRGLKTVVIETDPQKSAKYALENNPHVDYAYVDVEHLNAIVNHGSDDHDVVIFDVPPGFAYIDEYVSAVKEADFTLIPVLQDGSSFDSARTLLQPLTASGATNWAIVVNRSSPSTFFKHIERQMHQSLIDQGFPVMNAIIRDRRAWLNLNLLNDKNLIHDSRDGSAKHEIESLYAEIVERISAIRSEK